MALLAQWTETFKLEGVGNGFANIECYPSPAHGILNTVPSIRSTGAITSLVNIWWVRDTAVSLISGTPVDDYVIADGTPGALAANTSETDRFTSTVISTSPFFNKGLGIIVEVTNTTPGAWAVFVTVEFQDLDAPGVS